QDVSASMSRPVKELKNFHKLLLKAGESRTVSFNISEDDLKFYNSQLQRVAEPGQFNVQVGLDSEAVQQQSFELL
ncbi:MAG: beta-glucosidase, partial [Rubrivivax sp.]